MPFSAADRLGPPETLTLRSAEEAVTTKVFPDGNGGLAAWSPSGFGNRILKASWIWVSLCASLSWGQSSANLRAPLGVYVKVDVQDAIDGYNGPAGQRHSYLQGLYANLLADPAISGLTIGAEWAKLQPSAGTSPSSFVRCCRAALRAITPLHLGPAMRTKRHGKPSTVNLLYCMRRAGRKVQRCASSAASRASSARISSVWVRISAS